MLTELNKEQELLIDSVKDEWISLANSGKTVMDKETAMSCMKKIYLLATLKEPDVMFFDGPRSAVFFCKEKLNVKNIRTIDHFGLGYDAGWVAFLDYFQRIGVLNKNEEHDLNVVIDLFKSGVWGTILFDELALCISCPSIVRTDKHGNLHCEDGPAIRFNDGYEEYCWNGTWVDKKIIMDPSEITKEDIGKEKNSEISRAIAERLGWDEYFKRADVVLVDKWFDTGRSNHYELYDFKKRWTLTPKLLKMESPELNNGTRPWYVEPVHPDLKNCQAARKWQFQKEDGSWPTPNECNGTPDLEFEIET